MTKLILPIFIIVIILSQFSCKWPTSPDTRFYGSWNWINTTGGFAVQSYSPPPSILIKFNNDSICSIYRNDTLLYNRNYSIRYDVLYRLPDSTYDTTYSLRFFDTISDTIISYKEFTTSYENTYTINNDTLIIWDLRSDGFNYTYVKAY